MRRRIDSEYIRKRRYSRRAKDNWRRVKRRTKIVDRSEDIVIVGSALFLLWLCLMGILFSMVW